MSAHADLDKLERSKKRENRKKRREQAIPEEE
jgi:hypothetical protein